MVDRRCGESKGKAKIEGTRVSNEEAHHPPTTEIVTVLSHLATGECWGTEGKAESGEEDMAQEKAGDKVWSDQVLHQSGSSEEDKEDEKEHEGELENKVMEVYVGVEAINTRVIHHP